MEQCQHEVLVWGRELYIDATEVEANASLASVKPRFFVEAHLADLFGAETEELPKETDQHLLPTLLIIVGVLALAGGLTKVFQQNANRSSTHIGRPLRSPNWIRKLPA